jgi:CheY-like chemotaxis protein
MDLAMPDMTGWQLAAAVHARHAELPIVLTTGFIDPASESELARLNITGVLMKPWTMSSLAQAVQVALQKNPEGIR